MRHRASHAFSVIFSGLAVASIPVAARAAVSVDYHGGAQASQSAYDSILRTDDLVNNQQPTLASVSAPDSTLPDSFNKAGLNDGLAAGSTNGSNANMTYYSSSVVANGAAVIFTLGGSSTGYDITQIDSFAGWNDHNIGAQNFQLLLKIGSADYVDYGTYTNTAGFGSDTLGASLATRTTLTGGTTPIASGVTGIELRYLGTGLDQTGSDGGTVIREIDVAGTPTAVPEPTALGLLGIASAGLFARRRHRGNA